MININYGMSETRDILPILILFTTCFFRDDKTTLVSCEDFDISNFPSSQKSIPTFSLAFFSSHLPYQQPSRCQQSPACQQPAIASQLPVIMNRWCGYLWWRIWHDYRVHVFTTWLINFGIKITDKTMNTNFNSLEYWVTTKITKVEIWSDEDWNFCKKRVEQSIRKYTHTHTHAQTHTLNHPRQLPGTRR